MLTVTGNRIYLTKRDSAYFKIDLKDNSGAEYIPYAGDKIYFKIRKNIFSDAVVFVKEIPKDTLILELTPEDTANLEITSYRYEIEIVSILGQNFTVINDGVIYIGPDVGLENVPVETPEFSLKGTVNVASLPEPVYSEYADSYEITPSNAQQVIAVKGKVMTEDITIKAISYQEETTETGGKIITIGGG
ncbi:MAG: hypothetical protein IJQ56_06980 [Synergistaceae bacterium]|nr:hypothetical protein [Synergistaceae bacterium]